MPERTYSVKQIDDLRVCCRNKYLFGHYSLSQMISTTGQEDHEITKSVEEMVRTHMMAGHTAADLVASE